MTLTKQNSVKVAMKFLTGTTFILTPKPRVLCHSTEALGTLEMPITLRAQASYLTELCVIMRTTRLGLTEKWPTEKKRSENRHGAMKDNVNAIHSYFSEFEGTKN